MQSAFLFLNSSKGSGHLLKPFWQNFICKCYILPTKIGWNAPIKKRPYYYRIEKKCFDFFLSETVTTLEGFEKCAGAIFLDPLCPYMGMPQNGSQGQRVKIQTLSNMVILYIIRSKILFWTTFVRTLYSENQPFSSYKPKCEGNWRIWHQILSSPLHLLI